MRETKPIYGASAREPLSDGDRIRRVATTTVGVG